MSRPFWLAAVAAAIALPIALNFAFADPEVGPPPGPPPHEGPHGGHRPPPDPLRRALDADGNHEISADEIANAASALKTLDKNGDGKLDREEMRPPMPPHMRDRDHGRDGDRRGPPRDDRDGRRGPPREGREGGRESREGRRGPSDGDRGDFRGPPRPEMPGPEMIVERMMEFDADGDGKLDKSELMLAAETIAQKRREFRERMGRWMSERRP